MCIDCTYPVVSLILTTSKSVSGQGRKMNMNSCLWWHKYLKKNSMHIRVLKSSREYVILVSWNESQHFMALWYFMMTMCHWQKAWPSQIFVLNFSLHFLITTKKRFHIVNIDFLTKTIQSSTLQALMNTYNFFLESTIIDDTQKNHIWTNASIQQCHFESTQAYCTNYKFIYFVFKLCSPICITIQYHKMTW